MGGRVWRALAVAMIGAVLAGCGAGSSSEPAGLRFERVDLPPGDQLEEISAAGDDLLVGIRRDGQPTAPGLLRLTQDGAINPVPLTAATPYGRSAHWYSITSDGRRILGIGGDRGGAHSNVRWSIWSGAAEGVAEHSQAFSTFGGWGAGDLVDAVLTPTAPALVGSWQSAFAGLDVAVWTAQGETWTRQSSAGSPLESTRTALEFAAAATRDGNGVLIAGWQLGLGPGGGQAPVVWRATAGTSGWTRTTLPDGGTIGAAVAARCWDSPLTLEGCGVSGRVDGALALWRLTGDTWTRVRGTPPVAVGENERLAAPLAIDARLAQFVTVDGQVRLVSTDGTASTVRPIVGPTGTVSSAVTAGKWTYLRAGADPNSQQLWRAETSTLH